MSDKVATCLSAHRQALRLFALQTNCVAGTAAQGATAQDQSASPPSSLEAQMQFRMGKADLNRLKGYLTGR